MRREHGDYRFESTDEILKHCCAPGQASSWSDDEDDKHKRRAGFLGYPYADEGYEAMAAIRTAGYRDMAEYGSWPFVWAMVNRAELRVALYCEGDFALETWTTNENFNARLRELVKEHPCDG